MQPYFSTMRFIKEKVCFCALSVPQTSTCLEIGKYDLQLE